MSDGRRDGIRIDSKGGMAISGEATDEIRRLTERAEQAEARVREQAAETERLQAIVGKLPVTADGVPVVPGMQLYAPSETVCSYHKHDIAAGTLPRYAFSPLVQLVCETGIDHCAEMPICKCYSTREAAETARLTGEKGAE